MVIFGSVCVTWLFTVSFVWSCGGRTDIAGLWFGMHMCSVLQSLLNIVVEFSCPHQQDVVVTFISRMRLSFFVDVVQRSCVDKSVKFQMVRLV